MSEISQQENPKKFTQLPNSWEERGIELGIERGIEKVVLEMLKEKLPIELIAKVTQLDKDKIEELQKLN